MPSLPHNFPTLRQRGTGNHRSSVLIIGSGMSAGIVPKAGELLNDRRADAERALGCTTSFRAKTPPEAQDLYDWADEVTRQLTAHGDCNPKLTLAKALGIPSDQCWHGYGSTQRKLYRHRVVARFARERLWEQIWSLNWDCVLESAMENVGIKRNATDEGMPWPTVFKAMVTAGECANFAEVDTVKILKPHGCVSALVEAQKAKEDGDTARSIAKAERFLITATELNGLDTVVSASSAQTFIFATLCAKLASHPVVVAGWSVSEPYLVNYIKQKISPVLLDRLRAPLAVDELCIISRRFNTEGHKAIAECYGRDKALTHICVDQPGLDQDQLFLWIQGLYALDRLNLYAVANDRVALDALAAEIDQPPANERFVIKWVDNFLPAWVRLCWRCGLVRCCNREGARVSCDDIHLESQDEHIPWKLPNIERPDLKAAARLLAALHRSGHGDTWDFAQFPGGMYHDFRLIIPIPVGMDGNSNDLRGLKALIEAIKRSGSGTIERLSVIFIGPEAATEVPDGTKRELKQLAAQYLAVARFPNAESIDDIQLQDV